MTKRVLDIGNCGPDHHSLTKLVAANFDAAVDQAHQAVDALSLLEQNEYSLVVVNRLLDCDGTAGMAVISQLKAKYPELPVMLVTNFEEHQQAAIEAGCQPGYGKNDLFSDATIALLSKYL
jgi:DNA-binding response OmpR family regulator